jgi:hypothetical protein
MATFNEELQRSGVIPCGGLMIETGEITLAGQTVDVATKMTKVISGIACGDTTDHASGVISGDVTNGAIGYVLSDATQTTMYYVQFGF